MVVVRGWGVPRPRWRRRAGSPVPRARERAPEQPVPSPSGAPRRAQGLGGSVRHPRPAGVCSSRVVPREGQGNCPHSGVCWRLSSASWQPREAQVRKEVREGGKEGSPEREADRSETSPRVAAETETWGTHREVGRGSCHRSGVVVGAWS